MPETIEAKVTGPNPTAILFALIIPEVIDSTITKKRTIVRTSVNADSSESIVLVRSWMDKNLTIGITMAEDVEPNPRARRIATSQLLNEFAIANTDPTINVNPRSDIPMEGNALCTNCFAERFIPPSYKITISAMVETIEPTFPKSATSITPVAGPSTYPIIMRIKRSGTLVLEKNQVSPCPRKIVGRAQS